MPLPPEKKGKIGKVLDFAMLASVATMTLSLLTQTSEERMQMGQTYVVDPIARLIQKADAEHRERMNQTHPDYMPIIQRQ